MKVLTDSEEPVGIPITAIIPEINLAIDVCSAKKEISLKEYICEVRDLTYICISEKLPEAEKLLQVRKAFSNAHIYSDTHIMDDLEIIRERYTNWRAQN